MIVHLKVPLKEMRIDFNELFLRKIKHARRGRSQENMDIVGASIVDEPKIAISR